ncbi:MAG: MurT ligase domain-containing protein [Erysipelotrichaceae bacterium]|nr:MurT ligase domain-containing protein [Erysipelotrichaceae bacterium]
MRKTIAIIICKLIRVVGKLFKRGSSLPGEVALKIDPNILSEVKLPKYVIAVSGSNGKTSTVEMIHEVLTSAGFKVAFNYEGSNQIEGVTTLILDDANIKGECQSDVILMESDERYARHSFKQITPTHFVLTNLYRDQLTRNGNPEIIFSLLKEAIHDETKLILNADDPLVTLLGDGHDNNVYYDINKYLDKSYIGVYDDGAYCPKCKSPMKYTYRHYGSTGNYKCSKCGYKHPKGNYHITNVDLNKGSLTIDKKYDIKLQLKSIYNAYNILATYSLCKELGVNSEIIIKALNSYVLKNGRVTEFKLEDKQGVLLISKHENSTSYNQTLTVVKNDPRKVTVLVLVDAISRKYFTSETSWLWDIDFNLLDSKNVNKVVLAGLYASDLAERFEYTTVNKKKIYVEKDIDLAFEYLKNETKDYIYVVTCFSDMAKVFSRVEVQK